jgi:hypothetical protein
MGAKAAGPATLGGGVENKAGRGSRVQRDCGLRIADCGWEADKRMATG